MKKLIIMLAVLSMLAISVISRAQTGDANSFIGLWEGINPEDGSDDILSITDNGNGTFKLLLYSTYFTLCDGRRGIIQGTGKASTEQSLEADDLTLTCFETGDIKPLPLTFIRNSDGTLREASAMPVSPLVIYHRMNK